MKAYIVDPLFEMYGTDDDRTSAAIAIIVEVVLTALRAGDDTFHFAIVWANPGEMPGGTFDEGLAVPQIHDLQQEQALRVWLRQSVDPNVRGGGDIRSVATCRAVTFGYDGQAFLLLRDEDDPPVSPDPALVMVEERPDLLVRSDYFDGCLRSRASPASLR